MDVRYALAMPIDTVTGDITKIPADAVVNAANANLFVGGGVCGAIHRAGGPTIAEECRRIFEERGPLAHGESAITGAGKLPAKWVVHAVGPMWNGGGEGEADELAAAYRSAIALADDAGATSMTFPSISTGIFGYPVDEAAPVAIAAVRNALVLARNVRDVTFVLFDEATHAEYRRALEGAS